MTANSRSKSVCLRIALLTAIFVLSFISITAYAQQIAPDFTLPDLNGKMVSLKDFGGEIVFVDFWATWCIPCRKSLPELAELDKKYRDQGLVVLGLSIDDPDSFDNEYVREFKNRYNVEYQILRTDEKMMKSYLDTAEAFLPTLIIIDRSGKIVQTIVGYKAGSAEKVLKELLGEK